MTHFTDSLVFLDWWSRSRSNCYSLFCSIRVGLFGCWWRYTKENDWRSSISTRKNHHQWLQRTWSWIFFHCWSWWSQSKFSFKNGNFRVKTEISQNFALIHFYMNNFRLGLLKEEVLHHVPPVVFILILKRALLWQKLWIGQHGRNIEPKLLSRVLEDIDNREKLTSCRMVILYFSSLIRQTHRKQRNNDDVMITVSLLDRVSYQRGILISTGLNMYLFSVSSYSVDSLKLG